MAELLHIYMNNPTAGSTDGTEVSSGPELARISLSGVADKNTIFWVKALSTTDEPPQQDTSVDIQAEGLLVSG